MTMMSERLPGTPVEQHVPSEPVRYKIKEGKDWEAYIQMPDDLQRSWLRWCIDEKWATVDMLVKMLGVDEMTVRGEMQRHGVRTRKGRRYPDIMKEWDHMIAKVEWDRLIERTELERGAEKIDLTPEQEAEELEKAPEKIDLTLDEHWELLEIKLPGKKTGGDSGREATNEPEQEAEEPEQEDQESEQEDQEMEDGKQMQKKCVYIAGAISGRTDYKEAFQAAEEQLRERGFVVMNPANNGQDWSYRQYINVGLMELMHCDAIYMLRGWQDSVGARLEMEYARATGLEILYEAG